MHRRDRSVLSARSPQQKLRPLLPPYVRKHRTAAKHHCGTPLGSQTSLSTPDGPCKGVPSPDAWHAVHLQSGIRLNRPALESMPPSVRKHSKAAKHHCQTPLGSQMSLSTPDGPCKGVSSPDAWHAVPLQPGIGLNRPALESMPPSFRKHSKAAKHHCETPSGSQMSLSTPDGLCKGVSSPDAWHAVPLQPGIGLNRPALESMPP